MKDYKANKIMRNPNVVNYVNKQNGQMNIASFLKRIGYKLPANIDCITVNSTGIFIKEPKKRNFSLAIMVK